MIGLTISHYRIVEKLGKITTECRTLTVGKAADWVSRIGGL